MLSTGPPAVPESSRSPAGPHRAAVLGSPIAHSLSPVLHRAAYAHLGLTGWTYDARELVAGELSGFLAGLDASWAGLSLTMPLKEAALRVASSASALARELGAANTLVPTADGWHADNTDVEGLRRALEDTGGPLARSAVVVGSGATARSALVALHELGVREVTFVLRGALREATAAQCRDRGLATRVVPYAEAAPVLARATLVVSTVPTGGADLLADVLASRAVGDRAVAQPGAGRAVVLDVVYAGWPTPLARVYERRGARVVSGLEMLVHQAVAQVRLMTGRPVPPRVLRAAGLAALGTPAACGPASG